MSDASAESLSAGTEAVYRDLHGRLLSYLRGRVGNEADAEDLLQDVFTRIHENAHRLAEFDSVTGWIFRVTRNAVIDFYRARARAGRHEVLVATPEEHEPPRHAADERDSTRAELAACLEPLLARLPESYREPLTLTELRGMTHKAAAERLGISLSAMKSRVSRGREKLRGVLVDCCHIELDRRRGIASIEARSQGACQCGCEPP